MGHVDSNWLIKAWAQSRAASSMWSLEGLLGKGFSSLHRRFPRSNVKGIGFETVVDVWFVWGSRAFCCSAVSCVEGESSDMFAISVSASAIV